MDNVIPIFQESFTNIVLFLEAISIINLLPNAHLLLQQE